MEDDLEIKLLREIILEEEFSELDFKLSEAFSTADERATYDHIFTTNIDKKKIYLDNHEIEISKIKDFIKQSEDAGANYISIDYHEDHIGYELTSLKIERASSDIVDEARERELILKEAAKQAKINQLEHELNQLKQR